MYGLELLMTGRRAAWNMWSSNTNKDGIQCICWFYSQGMQCIVMYATGVYSGYLKLVLRYKLLILDTYHPDNLHLHEQGHEDLWLFYKTKRGLQANNFGIHWYNEACFETLIWMLILVGYALSYICVNTLMTSFCHFCVNYKIMNALECTQTNHDNCISKLVSTNPSVVYVTAWNRVFEKLIILLLLRKSLAFCENWCFTSVFRTFSLLLLFGAR